LKIDSPTFYGYNVDVDFRQGVIRTFDFITDLLVVPPGWKPNVPGESPPPVAREVLTSLWLDKSALATTWSTGVIGKTPNPQHIRDVVKDCVDQFLNAWLSVNKKP
jgi:hypothetical protein